MKIRENKNLPTISWKTISGKEITNESIKGKKTVIFFFRYASCILCHLYLHSLIEKSKNWKGNFKLIAIFQSPESSIKEYAPQIPFEIIADPSRKIYAQFGVKRGIWGFIKSLFQIKTYVAFFKNPLLFFGKKEGAIDSYPAEFLVNKKSIVVKTHYGEDIGDHLNLDLIAKFITEKD